MTDFRKGWYLLYTLPRQEKKISRQLLEMNVTHYLPVVKTLRQWSDRVKTLYEPLFPSYLFIYLQNSQDYFTGLNADGVVGYVKFGGKIALVADAVVNDLRLVVGSGEALEVSSIEFQPGQMLIIAEGAFAGLQGEMVQHKNKEMLIIRINLLKRNILVALPVAQLIGV